MNKRLVFDNRKSAKKSAVPKATFFNCQFVQFLKFVLFSGAKEAKISTTADLRDLENFTRELFF